MSNRKFSESTIALVVVAVLLSAIVFSLGVVVQTYERSSARMRDDSWLVPNQILWGSLPLALVAGGFLVRAPTTIRIRATVLILSSLVATLLAEGLCRMVIPPWPARALHGIAPASWEAAATTPTRDSDDQGTVLNSWGERDRERTRRPSPGVRRVAFIGDSFLEEGASVPVSLLVESRILHAGFEVINLGVSATGPDEYFERVRGVAGPLGASHICLCVFAGNDFVSPKRTLPTYWGIAAVEPRPSLLTLIGLSGLNHVLTNARRPVVESWLSGNTLHAEEQQRFHTLRRLSDDEMRSALENAAPRNADERARLSARLHRDDAGGFFQMLREPDEGRFRSYYLANALDAAATGDGRWSPNDVDVAWHWTQETARWCRDHHIGLTIVVIPEAFQVDERMRSQWLPLADMRIVTASCRAAAREFVRRGLEESLDIIDLHAAFEGSQGTYLNLDGHWSQSGADLAADVLARHLVSRLEKPVEH